MAYIIQVHFNFRCKIKLNHPVLEPMEIILKYLTLLTGM